MLHMLPGREMAGHLKARVKRQHDMTCSKIKVRYSTKESSLFVLLLCSCLHPQNQTKWALKCFLSFLFFKSSLELTYAGSFFRVFIHWCATPALTQVLSSENPPAFLTTVLIRHNKQTIKVTCDSSYRWRNEKSGFCSWVVVKEPHQFTLLDPAGLKIWHKKLK